MTGPLQRRAIADGVWFSRIHDPKFYHNSISVTIITPLAEGKTSAAVLAAYLLRMGSRRCRDMTELECRLADLYGAVLDTDISRHGENQLLTFSIAGADDRFALEGESISRGCAELLGEILLEPKVEGDAFPEEAFRLEQQYLIDTIEAEINDKRSYAAQRCTAEMGRGCRFALPRYGTVQETLSATPKEAYGCYRELIRTARIEIFFSGCGSPDYAEEVFTKLFDGVERTPLCPTPQRLPRRAERVSELAEQLPMSQSKLVLGFRTGLPRQRRARTALRVMTALLGGSTGSRLFTMYGKGWAAAITAARESTCLPAYCLLNAAWRRPTGSGCKAPSWPRSPTWPPGISPRRSFLTSSWRSKARFAPLGIAWPAPRAGISAGFCRGIPSRRSRIWRRSPPSPRKRWRPPRQCLHWILCSFCRP